MSILEELQKYAELMKKFSLDIEQCIYLTEEQYLETIREYNEEYYTNELSAIKEKDAFEKFKNAKPPLTFMGIDIKHNGL